VILVDTSAWIHWVRPDGDAAVRRRVELALTTGEACWCAMVRLELWNGAGGEREKKVLRDFERYLPDLPISADVWNEAAELARQARARAITVPATDLLIAACARHHGAALETADSDFDLLAEVPRTP
jgi:predicted nucleic acid-binding protein